MDAQWFRGILKEDSRRPRLYPGVSRLLEPSTHSLAQKGQGWGKVLSQVDLQRGEIPHSPHWDHLLPRHGCAEHPPQRGLRPFPSSSPSGSPRHVLRPPVTAALMGARGSAPSSRVSNLAVGPGPERGQRIAALAWRPSTSGRLQFTKGMHFSSPKGRGDVSCSSHCAGSGFVYQFQVIIMHGTLFHQNKKRLQKKKKTLNPQLDELSLLYPTVPPK